MGVLLEDQCPSREAQMTLSGTSNSKVTLLPLHFPMPSPRLKAPTVPDKATLKQVDLYKESLLFTKLLQKKL